MAASEPDQSTDPTAGDVDTGPDTDSDGTAEDEFACPTCGDTFDTKRGRSLHHYAAHDVSLAMAECEECGETFKKSNDSTRFCSRECVYASRRKRVEKTCPACDETFVVTEKNSDQTYCSHACYYEQYRAEFTCEECGETSVMKRSAADGRYCSTACRRKAGRTEFTCEECEETFTAPKSADRTYCSRECATAARRDRASKTCAHCETSFETKYRDQTYCTQECAAAAKRERVTMTCEVCGRPFQVRQAEASYRKYCSSTCVGRAQRERETLICEECGEVISVPPSRAANRKYCSRECAADARSVSRQLCEGCGTSYDADRSDRKYCTHACSAEARRTRETECVATIDPLTEMDILHTLYVREDYTIDETWRRYNTFRRKHGCERLSKPNTRQRLIDYGIFDPPKNYAGILANANSDEIGVNTPDGDDSWRSYYQVNSDD